jgi:hypothetical protein
VPKCLAGVLHFTPGHGVTALQTDSVGHRLLVWSTADRCYAKIKAQPTGSCVLRRDQGRRTEAYDLLAPIYGWFTEGSDTPDLTEAKALLHEMV